MAKLVIAIGGNAISDSSSLSSFHDESSKMRLTIREIARLYKDGNKVAVTHGNGPQVGSELERNELASYRMPEIPLYYLTAETQSIMGAVIETAIKAELYPNKREKEVCTVLSHALVSQSDPGMKRPSKPIGPFMTKRELNGELKRGKFDYYQKGNKYRRIVASPQPLHILEEGPIKKLYQSSLVICCGGGGIPVVRKGNHYSGVNAVIDKDLSTGLIASKIGAEKMFILTDAEYLYSDFASRKGKISEIRLRQLKRIANRLEPGTIRPKVLSCIYFLEHGGREAYIGSVYELKEIMEGKKGTRIIK